MDVQATLIEYGLPALFVGLVLAGLGMPVPEDIFMITGGVLVARQATDGAIPWGMVVRWNLVLYAGVMVGDSIVYGLGRRYGDAILRQRRIAKLFTPQRVLKVRGYYAKYGAATVSIARHTAPIRFVTFLMAGVSRMSFAKFFFWDSLAAILSVPLWFAAGYAGNQYFASVQEKVHWVVGGVAAAAAVALVVVLVRRRRRSRAAAAAAAPLAEARPAGAADGGA
ncbi:MAG TPA: DedA family protein [Planctomycetota bacterium]|nr:DedA family protein [Planctomycetota bacterium]